MVKPAERLLDGQAFEEQLALKDRALAATAEGITISDPSLPDNPIIYANEGFERLTGYRVEDVLGRNCRFLQGDDTDPHTVQQIRDAIGAQREVTVQLLNYKKDGTPFWNRLSITPVRDAAGTVTHYIGIQSDITEQKQAEEALASANRRLRRDLDAAARVQRALLPGEAPEIPELQIAWAFRPCTELAGDSLNFYRLDDRHIAFYILDVSGHGAAAALLSVTANRFLSPRSRRSILVEADPAVSGAPTPAAPAAVVRRLNESFPFDARTAQFFTLFYGFVDLRARDLRYASAGHPPAIHVPREGAPATLATRGHPIGLLAEPRFENERLALAEGDRVYLYTDGLIEAEDCHQRQFGLERLMTATLETRDRTIQESVDQILASVEDWCGDCPLEDDVSLLALETRRSD